MNDPRTRKAVWGWTVGAGGRWAKGENWDNCNRITKNFKNQI